MSIETFIDSLTESDLIEIVEDYEKFRKDGTIGECLLRSKAESLMVECGSALTSPILWMETITTSVHRILALRLIYGVGKK